MTEHYFTSDEPATARELRDIAVEVRGRALEMVTADQVFSSRGLDIATKILLDEVPSPPPSGTFLDLGCGWGPIAALLATESPAATVWAVDVSKRALDLTRRNAARLHLANIEVQTAGEALARADFDDVKFDLIWSNPPVRIGKQPLQQLLVTWLRHLAKDGEAYLVIGKNLGADSIAKWLVDRGFDVRRIASKRSFRVLRVRHQLETF